MFPINCQDKNHYPVFFQATKGSTPRSSGAARCRDTGVQQRLERVEVSRSKKASKGTPCTIVGIVARGYCTKTKGVVVIPLCVCKRQ